MPKKFERSFKNPITDAEETVSIEIQLPGEEFDPEMFIADLKMQWGIDVVQMTQRFADKELESMEIEKKLNIIREYAKTNERSVICDIKSNEDIPRQVRKHLHNLAVDMLNPVLYSSMKMCNIINDYRFELQEETDPEYYINETYVNNNIEFIPNIRRSLKDDFHIIGCMRIYDEERKPTERSIAICLKHSLPINLSEALLYDAENPKDCYIVKFVGV